MSPVFHGCRMVSIGIREFVVVATPTHLHVEQTLEVVRRGFPVFVEKPLSHTADGFEVVDEVKDKKLASLVGCNMRFHPGPAKVKQLLKKACSEGFYLREFIPARTCLIGVPALITGATMRRARRPEEDAFWTASTKSIWRNGIWVTCKRCSAAPDISVLLRSKPRMWLFSCAVTRSGAISEIHLDYVQRTYERGCQIVGELGSIFWDFNVGVVRWYNAESGEWKTYSQPETWETNQMYVDEMKHFVESIHGHRSTMLTIPEAAVLMRVVFAAKDSSMQGKMVPVSGELTQ